MEANAERDCLRRSGALDLYNSLFRELVLTYDFQYTMFVLLHDHWSRAPNPGSQSESVYSEQRWRVAHSSSKPFMSLCTCT